MLTLCARLLPSAWKETGAGCVQIVACQFCVAHFLFYKSHQFLRTISLILLCVYNLLSLTQQEIENFKKLNLNTKGVFDNLAPDAFADPTQEVPPGAPGLRKGK